MSQHQLLELPDPSKLRVYLHEECFSRVLTVSHTLESWGSGFGFVKLFGITVTYSVLEV